MATASKGNNTITQARQAATLLLKAAADLELAAASWNRGISTQIFEDVTV